PAWPALLSRLHTLEAASSEPGGPTTARYHTAEISFLHVGRHGRKHVGVFLLQFGEGIQRIQARLLGCQHGDVAGRPLITRIFPPLQFLNPRLGLASPTPITR